MNQMTGKENRMRLIALNGLEEAERMVGNRAKDVTYDDVVRAARAAQAAAEDLNKLAGYMLWRKEAELEAKLRPLGPLHSVPFEN